MAIFTRWQNFVGTSPLRRLGHNAMVSVMTSLAAKVAGFSKEIFVAMLFGISNNLDIYYVAFALIGFPLAILLNAIQSVFIAKLSSDHLDAKNRQLYSLTTLGTLVLLLLVLPLWLWLVPYILPWLASGFPLGKQQALQNALLWFIPYYFLSGINLLGYGMLQSKGKFLQNGIIPVVTPLIIMCNLAIFGTGKDWHILVYTLGIGSFVECALLVSVLTRMRLVGVPDFSQFKKIRSIFYDASKLLPGTLMGACVLLVEQSIAAKIGEGSNAALAYGYRLPIALQGMFVTAIGITALPYFSSQIAQKQYDYCLSSLNKLFCVLAASGMLLALSLGVFSSEITSLLYQRGAFDAVAVDRVAPIQIAYFMQIPFSLLSILGIKVLIALGRNGLVGFISVLAGALQCFLAYTLAQRFDVAGIAWAATAMSAAIACLTFVSSRSILKKSPYEKSLFV